MANTKVAITIKDMGTVTVELYPEKAPLTVENFLKLVSEDFYTDLIFHRVIPGFMIQGGGMLADFEAKKAESIKGEFAANGFVQNDIKHTRGVLSMARTNEPNSASSQFFIMHQDSPHLDGMYAAFGKVIDGMDIVDKIASCQTGTFGWYQDVPTVPIIIEKAQIID